MKKIVVHIYSLFLIIGLVSCNSNKGENQNGFQAEQSTKSDTRSVAKENIQIATEAKFGSGEKIFKDNGCLVCHQLNTKLVGPSLKDISTAYTGNKEDLFSFLRGNGEPVVDPAQKALMQPQIAITKKMSDAELSAVVEYILSVK